MPTLLSAAIWGLAQSSALAETATPPVPAADSELIEMPDGAYFLPAGPDQPDKEKLSFQQIARSKTEVKVFSADKAFDANRLPATFKLEFLNKSVCTATLIGPRVLLTAAHCVDRRVKNGSVLDTIPAALRLSSERIDRPLECQMAAAYIADDPALTRRPRNAHDFALCSITYDTKVKAETLLLDAASLSDKSPVLLAGYGCTEESLRQERIPRAVKISAILNVGRNTITDPRYDGWARSVGRIGQPNEAVICPGDSGGAVYVRAGLDRRDDNRRRISAVNSAVGPSTDQVARWKAGQASLNGPEYVSYLAPFSDPSFRDLVAAFQAADPAGRRICGLDMPELSDKCRY